MKRWILMFALSALVAGGMARGQMATQSVVKTPHNLSAGGTGPVRATSETEVCIFCHTPHHSTVTQPLWNRQLSSVSNYKPYSSSSLKSSPNQPTGSSKLCLSCHDGTIALGSVTSRHTPIAMAPGMTYMPAGSKGNLGTDLSDDHPISFVYDAALVNLNPQLKDPASLPKEVALDANKEVQCTTCHDAHNNSNGAFLVKSNENSALCNTCHVAADTDVAGHQDCNGCHQMHTAPSGPYLLVSATVTDTCLPSCHSSSPQPLPLGKANTVAWSEEFSLAATDKAVIGAALAKARRLKGPNVESDMGKSSRHDTHRIRSPFQKRGADEVVCSDCHEPHSIRKQVVTNSATADPSGNTLTVAPRLSGIYGKIGGTTVDGGARPRAQTEYEVCFKCHGDNNTVRPTISRQLVQTNVRLQFAPSAASYHPVAARGKNNNVPSLIAPYSTASRITCTDCHGSDSSKRGGGSGVNGPHGSNFAPLLVARYETADFTNESATNYALCYRCHERTSILGNQSFPFHSKHITDQRTPCSACHTGHGNASGQATAVSGFALINFDTLIVQQVSPTQRVEYRHTGTNHGSCTLTCHGKAHVNKAY